MEHPRGDALEITFPLKGNNVTLDNLDTLVKVIFSIKIKKDDADDDALIFLDSTVDVTNFDIDTSSGVIEVSVDSDDMDLVPVGDYYYALQLHWSGSRRFEVYLYENGKRVDGSLKIIQDTIDGTT